MALCQRQIFFFNILVVFLLSCQGKTTTTTTSRKLEEKNIDFKLFELIHKSQNSYTLKNNEEVFHIPNTMHDKDLFHEDFTHYEHSDTSIETNNDAQSLFHCIQRGKIFNSNYKPVGIARINSCHNSFSAHFDIHIGRALNIESYNTSHVISYHEDSLKEEWGCGSETHAHENIIDVEPFLKDTVDNTRFLFEVDVQSRIKFVKLLVVNDNARFLEHGVKTSAHSAHLVQRLQLLYDKFGTKFLSLYPASEAYLIKISIAGMVTFKTEDPWEHKLGESVDAHELLELFAEWKRLQSAETPNFPSHSVGHLLSGRDFKGGTVGLANLFAICKTQVSVGINQAKDFQDETIATIMAHELAHNLGVYHTDTTYRGSLVSSPCGGFIMDSNGIRNTEWSKCSVNYLKMFFDGHPENCEGNSCVYPRRYGTRLTPACLEDPPERVWSLSGSESICGNGVRENDEQCDCGQEDCSEIDPCCDGKTCTFLSDDYECSNLDSCCDSCYIAPKASPKEATPCREAISDCDTPEYCDGQSAICPYDAFKSTGTSCYDEELDAEGSCFIGNCNSHRSQCLDYSYLGFDGPCISKDGNNGDKACNELYCHKQGTSSSSCAKVYVNQAPVQVLDGTSCGKNKVCDASKGECVASSLLEVPVSLSCSNGILDADETDIDCGGPQCFPCIPGDSCLRHTDCYNHDCVNSSITSPTTGQVSQEETVEPENGCTSVKNQSGCSQFNGCIWLEEFTRCKKTGEYPPSGDCFTQKKRQSCINFNKCEWDFANDRCIEILGEVPSYGHCSGELFQGNDDPSWWSTKFEEFQEFLESNQFLGYTLIACSVCSLFICGYVIVSFGADKVYLSHELKKEKERKKRREARAKRRAERIKKEKENQRPYSPKKSSFTATEPDVPKAVMISKKGKVEQKNPMYNGAQKDINKESQSQDIEIGTVASPDMSQDHEETSKNSSFNNTVQQIVTF